jgi:hypothetical protein
MIALTPNAFSQSSGMGIEGGINLADISIAPLTVTTSSRTGMMVGAFADIGITRSFYIRPGLRYVMKGFSSVNNNGFVNVTTTTKISYLEFPALLKVAFPLTEVKPYVMAGPTLGIMLSATQEQTDGVNNASGDVSQFLETIDFGLYFGGGIDFHVAKKIDMFVGAGYSLGLTNIVKPNPNNLQQVTGKNLGIQVTAGMKFGL